MNKMLCKDILIEIFKLLSIEDIYHVHLLNKYIYNILDESFWMKYFIEKYGYDTVSLKKYKYWKNWTISIHKLLKEPNKYYLSAVAKEREWEDIDHILYQKYGVSVEKIIIASHNHGFDYYLNPNGELEGPKREWTITEVLKQTCIQNYKNGKKIGLPEYEIEYFV